MAVGNEPDTFILCKEFLEETIDPDSGLLDKLLSNNTLSQREIRDFKAQLTYHMRNACLLQCIIDKKQQDCFLTALKDTKQTHIVNYLNSKGEYNADEFGDEWPLRGKELSILNTNQEVLIDLIEPVDLVGRLYSRGVINKRQRDSISSKPTCHEKNEVLLEVLRRRSIMDFKVTIRCLHESNQSHLAEILEQGGVVVKVHAEGLDDTTEEEIITVFQGILSNKSCDESLRILEQTKLRVISANKGESIVLYVYCKTVIQIIQLKEMQIKGTLRTAVQILFMKLLTIVQCVEVAVENPQIPFEHPVKRQSLDLQNRHSQFDGMTITLSEYDYNRCRSYFPGKTDIKLRATHDFSSQEMTEKEEIELENILQSMEIGQQSHQEEKTHLDEAAEKVTLGDDTQDDEQSEETLSIRNVEQQKLEERTEEENVKQTEKEQEKSVLSKFDVDTLHKSESNLMENLEEERLFHPEEMKSKPKLKESEASTEAVSEDLEIISAESEDASKEHLNPYQMALNFKKGDLLEAILPADIGDTINWWSAIHLESGKIGYVPRRLVVIDYQMDFDLEYETSAATSQTKYLNSSINNLPLELLDSILQKSCLQRVLREKHDIVLKNKDYHTVSKLMSVDCCWFQRIRRRKFKKELWRSLFALYQRKEKISSIYRINRQFLEENSLLQGLVTRLKSNDCLTDAQAASLYRQNLPLGKKNSFERFRDLISEVVKKTEAMDSVFRRWLIDTKQHLISVFIEKGGATTKVEIKLQRDRDRTSAKTRHENLQIVDSITKLRDKTKARSLEIEDLIDKLKEDDLEILNASWNGDVIVVWIWCKTKYAIEKPQIMNRSKHVIDVFTELIKNLLFSSKEKILHAKIKPKVNIDFEQFEKTVVFFSIVAKFASRLLNLRKEEYVRGVTKLRNEIHVLLSRSSAPHCVILVFEDEIPYRLQKRIKIKEIENPSDIASIEMENSLYVLDFEECIWKIKDEKEKKKKIIRWLELRDYSDGPSTLSVIKGGQLLLVGLRKDDRLWSLRIFGGGESKEEDLRFSILLPEEIRSPYQSVETSKGNFIIFHMIIKEKKEEELFVVSEVSGDGMTILRRFTPKNKDQKLLSLSGHFAVDSFDRVFLTDLENDRVFLFDSDLQWNGILIPTKEDGKIGRNIWRPESLFYDEEKKELIIGGGAEVVVYTLNNK